MVSVPYMAPPSKKEYCLQKMCYNVGFLFVILHISRDRSDIVHPVQPSLPHFLFYLAQKIVFCTMEAPTLGSVIKELLRCLATQLKALCGQNHDDKLEGRPQAFLSQQTIFCL